MFERPRQAFAKSCNEHFLWDLLMLGARLQNGIIVQKTKEEWLERLKADNNQVDIAMAINAGESLIAREFLGIAYYIAMLKTAALSSERTSQRLHCVISSSYPPNLTPQQRIRIDKGSASLGALWDSVSRHYLSQASVGPPVYGIPSPVLLPTDQMFLLLQKPAVDALGKLELLLTHGHLKEDVRNKLQGIYDYHSQNLHLHFLDDPTDAIAYTGKKQSKSARKKAKGAKEHAVHV